MGGDGVGDAQVAAGGVDESGEHFEGGGFSGSIGSQKADNFSGFDRERDVLDGGDVFVLPLPEVTESAFDSGCFVGDFIDFGEIFDLNNWHSMRF